MKKLNIALDALSPEETFAFVEKNILPLEPQLRDRIHLKCNDFLLEIGLDGIREFSDALTERYGYTPTWMIDGKWYDIPNTVANYAKRLAGLHVAYYTVHASGGPLMIRAAKAMTPDIKLLAITILTSMQDQEVEEIYGMTRNDAILWLAKSALESGADGLVCAPTDVPLLRGVFWEDFLLVTPGIMQEGKVRNDDQNKKLTMTPREAIANGASDIVVGRPILQSEDPQAVIREMLIQMDEAEKIPSEQDFSREKLIYTGNWESLLWHIGAIYQKTATSPYVRLTSGFLSDGYVNFGSTERDYRVVDRACRELTDSLRTRNITGDIVIGAQMGSVRISLPLAKMLGIETSIYTEKDGDAMKLKRHDLGADGFRDKKIILSEDVITTGSTLGKMIEMVRAGWGEVVAITSVVNRSGRDDFDGIPLVSCYVPPAFSKWWDEKTLETIRKNLIEAGKNPEEIDTIIADAKHEPPLPSWSVIVEKPKNEWNTLIQSMQQIK